jgi:hypothetical protein
MNTDRISGELFANLMHLLDLEVRPDREDVAVGYLEKSECIDLTPVKDEGGQYHVNVSTDNQDTGSCAFDTEREALKFIDALVFLGHADELAAFDL